MSRLFQTLERMEKVPDMQAGNSSAPVSADRWDWSKRQQPGPAPAVQTTEGVESHLVSLLDPTGFEAEQYRILRHTVEQKRRETGLCMIAVSSATVGDGKTVTAINLAGALAQAAEARVLLVDMDLRRPSVTEQLGLGHSHSRGLVDAILNPGLSLEDIVRWCPSFNLAVISSGRPLSVPYEVLKSARLGEIWQEARRCYDYIVLDTPPLISLPDCRLIGKWADGFLVVVAAHKTPQRLVEEAINLVDPEKMVGLVFNKCDRPKFRYNYYYTSDRPPSRAGWFSRLKRRKAQSA